MQAIRKHKTRDNAGQRQKAAGAPGLRVQGKQDTPSIRTISPAVKTTPSHHLCGQRKQSAPSIRPISPAVKSTPKLDLQARLTIGEPGDKYEKEADHVAEQVAGPAVQRTPSLSAPGPSGPELKRPHHITPVLHQRVEEPKTEETRLQEEEEAVSDMNPSPRRVSIAMMESGMVKARGPPPQMRTKESEGRLEHELRQSKGGGEPLPEKLRLEMEEGIGADFSGVRVHRDDRAEKMSQMLNARAFANGGDIYFNQGKFAPETQPGRFLLAHELTHTVQQGASPRVQRSCKQRPRAPPVQAGPCPGIQGGWIGDKLNDYARHIPGWELFTVIIGYNPLTERDVDRTPRNFLLGFMGLVPGGALLYDKLEEGGVIDKAFKWLNGQISDLDLSWTRLRNALDDAWDDMDFIRLDPFDYNIRVLKRHLKPIWEDVKTFGGRVIDKTVELARELLLVPLTEFVKERTRAYPLLSVILGEDPVTGEKVERNLYNIVSAFLLLTESGEEYLNKLNESGKLLELSEWLDNEIEKLNVGPEVVTDAFKRAFELLDLNAVIHPLDTITKLWNIFSGPVTRLFNFVINVAMKVLGLIKDWLLGLLKEYAGKIPGYPLLTVLLEKDPLTGEKVPRTPENFIRGFMSFVPGGLEKFRNLQKSGAITKAFKWLGKAITKLGLIGRALINAFTRMWESFSINDLTNPVAAFKRVVAIFTEPVKKIIDFAVEVGLKVLEFIFDGVLGPTGARVLAILKKAKSTFMKIIKNPVKFVQNLINAVMKGFRQFSSNILKHLKAGLIGWLTGTLGSAGVKLPDKWDLKGIVTFVLGILGLTYDRIRPKLVKVLGEKTVGILETTFEVVMLLFKEGPGAVWKKILEYMDNLKEKVMGGIRDWVITKVVTSAVTKIATMLNPAGAVIQAIIATYNTVMFFIERINQILDLVESVVNSISRIAAGKINDAANFVEQAMARTIPVIISFLARLLGLGNISGTIQKIIKKLQGTVDKALDKVIAWIVKQAKRLIKAGKGAVAKIFSWWKKKSTYTDAAGKGHKIYFTGKGKDARLTRESPTPVVFDQYVKDLETYINADTSRKAKYGPRVPVIKDLQKKISDTQYRITSKGKVTSRHFTEEQGKELQTNLDDLTTELKSVPGPDLHLVVRPRSKITPGALQTTTPTPNMVAKGYDKADKTKEGTGVVADPLTMTADQSGSKASYNSNLYAYLAQELNLNMVAGHIIYHRLHGSGSDSSNIAPISGSDNRKMESRFETDAFNAVFNDNAVLHYEVTFTYGGSGTKETDLLPTSISVDVYKKRFKGKETPADREDPAKYDGREADIHKDAWTLEIPSVSAGATVADKIKALEAAIVTELAKNPKLEWRGSTPATGFTRIPHVRNNFEGLAAPDEAKIRAAFDLEKTRIKNLAKAELRAGLSNAAFLAGISAFLKSTVLTMGEVAAEIRSAAGTTTSESSVKRWRSKGMPTGTQDKFLAKKADEEPPRTKKELSAPGDKYEQEADEVADHMAGERAQGLPLPCITPLPRANRVLRSKESGTSQESPQLSGTPGRSRGPGAPLSTGVREQMEQGIGGDFSSVRIHSDSNAARLSRSIDARAFTLESDIYFNQGKYSPTTRQGQHLLAHELTHVVQQNHGGPGKPAEVSQAADKTGGDKGPNVPGNKAMQGLSPVIEDLKPPAPVKAKQKKKSGKAKAEKRSIKPGGIKKTGKKVKKTAMAVGKPAAKIKPPRSGGSDATVMKFMSSTASMIAASYPTLGNAVTGAMKTEKEQEKSSAPKLSAKNRGKKSFQKKPGAEEPKGKEAKIKESPAPGAVEKKPAGHKDLGAPLNNSRNNKVLDQGPAGGFLSWFKQRFTSFMSSVKTRDPGVNLSAGEKPKTDLSGDADPKRSEKQSEEGDRQAIAEKDKVAAGITANPGREEIQPVEVNETHPVKIEAAAQKVTTEKQEDMAGYLSMPLPEAVRKKSDGDMAPLLKKSLSKPVQDVKTAATKRNEDKKTETDKARKEAETLNKKAEKDQKQLVDQSRGQVEDEQKKGLDEADGHIKTFRQESGNEHKSLRDGVKDRVKADEGKAAARLKKAEQDAKKEKKKSEDKAAAKKRELKKKSRKKSWWDRVKDAVKSVVKAITKVIDVIFTALRKAVKFIIETAKKAALAVIEAGRKWIVDKLNKFRKWLKDKVTKYIGKVFPELAKRINKAIDKVVDKAIQGVNKVAAALKKGVEALANALGKVLDKILSVFQTALKATVQIAGAVLTGDFAEAAKIAFYATCDILGINPKSIMDFMERAGEQLGKIFKSPSKFFNNVAKGVKKGINQFKGNIKKHLLNGLITWLTGAMGDIRITLPEKFDLKGIFSLVMQILGLTYDNIRAKLVKKLGPKGERIVGMLEKSFTLVKDLMAKGPIALWDRLKKKLSGLKAQVMEGIRNVVIEKIVKAGVLWLISLLNPVSALLKAIKMLYDIVMFFIERWNSIVAFAQSVWNSVSALANGQIGKAANAVEQALARAIPMILGLLASLLGLGGIGKSVQKAIRKIRKPIDLAIEKILGFIIGKGKALFMKMTGKGKEKEKQTPEEREKNKKAAEKKIRAIMTKGTTLGKFRKTIPGLKKKYKVRDIKIMEGFDVKVINSDPSLIEVAVAHELGLTKKGKLVEARATGKGPAGKPKYDKPKPREEFTFGSFNARADHPETLKAVLARELSKHKLTLKEIEYNKHFSGFPDAPARPQKVDATIYGYFSKMVGKEARTGVSTIVGYMGNREASFRKKQYEAPGVTYDGGHLVAHSFGGPDAYYNLVPMKAKINRKVYGRIEKFMRNQVKVEEKALPLDKKKSNLELSVSLNYDDPTYTVDMEEFLDVSTKGLESEKLKLTKKKERVEAKKSKLEEIKKGLPKDPLKAARALEEFQEQRKAKKKLLKKYRKTDKRDLLVWNLVRHSKLVGLAGNLKEKKIASAQVANAAALLDPLDNLITKLANAVPGHLLIKFLKTRRRVIDKFIDEYEKEYKSRPRYKDDRRLALQGIVLRAHLRGLQMPRERTRSLEKELANLPDIPPDMEGVNDKIKDYDRKIKKAITGLKDKGQEAKLKTLEGKRFSGAGKVPVHSRIPHSFSVEVNYKAVPGKDGGHRIKDPKGKLKEFKPSDYQTRKGRPKEQYGTITLSNATPYTRLIIEKLAPKQEKAAPKAPGELEKEMTSGKAGDKYKTSREKRFRTTFAISQ
ncbi:MAG: DUF4157 domain-containing protein [Desulfobacteraceae bacterium]|nr:DUF4157 domain-containing protein [Desulfobacteraceae bacterium]